MSALSLLAATVLIVVTARVSGKLALSVGQPRIVGEMVAVLLLGTVLLGLPEGAVVGEDAATRLGQLGDLGIVLMMFVVGAGLDPSQLRRQRRALVTITLLAVSASAATGALVSLVLAGDGRPVGSSATVFALAVMAAIAVNGLPVTALILRQRELLHTSVGVMGMAVAGATTAAALLMLAFAASLTDGGASQWLVLYVVGAIVAVIALGRLVAGVTERGTPVALVWLTAACGLGLSAWLSARTLGTTIAGAMLFGAVAAGTDAMRAVVRRVAPITTVVLVPVFLAASARSARLAEIGIAALPALGLILAAIVAGKASFAYIAGVRSGLVRRDAATLAVTMSCGGVMTIAVATEAARENLITAQLHATFVLAALVTTAATAPVLDVVRRRTRNDDQRRSHLRRAMAITVDGRSTPPSD